MLITDYWYLRLDWLETELVAVLSLVYLEGNCISSVLDFVLLKGILSIFCLLFGVQQFVQMFIVPLWLLLEDPDVCSGSSTSLLTPGHAWKPPQEDFTGRSCWITSSWDMSSFGMSELLNLSQSVTVSSIFQSLPEACEMNSSLQPSGPVSSLPPLLYWSSCQPAATHWRTFSGTEHRSESWLWSRLLHSQLQTSSLWLEPNRITSTVKRNYSSNFPLTVCDFTSQETVYGVRGQDTWYVCVFVVTGQFDP